jgi:glutathione S-transferase
MDCRVIGERSDAVLRTFMPGKDWVETMLKIYGRNTSSNVQKAMWAIGELNLECERLDVGGAFGKNKEPDYLAMNPNGLVPTLVEGDFILWESNSIVRYLARAYGSGTLEPSDLKQIALANQWMDWQLSVVNPALFAAFWGLIRTPAEKRDMGAIAESQRKTTDAMKMLDAQLSRTAHVAGEHFSMGDIPVGVMAYRFRQLCPERPNMPHLERWYATVSQRPAFKKHVGAIPLS